VGKAFEADYARQLPKVVDKSAATGENETFRVPGRMTNKEVILIRILSGAGIAALVRIAKWGSNAGKSVVALFSDTALDGQ